MSYLYLVIAIVCEVVATSALKASDSFTKLGPSLIVAAGYAIAFYCLSHALRTIPVGVAYAIWSGMGIVLVTVAAYFLYKQSLNAPTVAGMVLIIAGVAVVNLFSKSGH